MQKNNSTLMMERSVLVLTLRCNLKCKLCSMYSPYYTPAPHFSYDLLEQTITKYFEVVDSVKKFTISGGEPLLHSDLPGIIELLRSYDSRIGEIELITNGTIVPSKRLLEQLHGSKMTVLVDDYGEDLSTKISDIATVLTKQGIRHTVRKNYGVDAHCGGWVNMLDFTRKNLTLRDMEEVFSRCAHPQKLKFCFTIVDGKMHPCSFSRRCIELGITDDVNNEYVDLFDESTSAIEKKEKLMCLKNVKSLSACEYCSGMCEDSKRYLPAEQL